MWDGIESFKDVTVMENSRIPTCNDMENPQRKWWVLLRTDLLDYRF